jgi:hypothetical protein
MRDEAAWVCPFWNGVELLPVHNGQLSRCEKLAERP